MFNRFQSFIHESKSALFMAVVVGSVPLSMAFPSALYAAQDTSVELGNTTDSVRSGALESESYSGKTSDVNSAASLAMTAPSSATAGSAKEFVLPLTELVDIDGPVTLRGPSNELNFALPVPALWQPTQVTLNLVGSASQALIDTSQLVLKVNDHVVQQFPLKDDKSRFQHAVEIPTALLKSGFNKVQIEVAQHSSQYSCENASAPELWTQIDARNSRFLISGVPRAIPRGVDELDALFDSADWSRRAVVPILTASAPTEGEISAMGLVAQGVGARYEELPVSLKHGQFPKAPEKLSRLIPAGSRGAILVGTFADLAPYLEGMEVPHDSAPVIAVRALPNDPTRFALILAARSHDELTEVATAFTLRSVPWPSDPWVAVNGLTLPEVGQAKLAENPQIPIAVKKVLPLKALGFPTTTYYGDNADGTSLRFWNNSWRGRLQVRVHLGYASGMSPESALNILANGTMHGSIPLNNPDGGSYFNYAVTVPTGSLEPGWNTLEFKPVLLPLTKEEGCKAANNNLAVTLYEDTVVQKTGGNELQQTDLALMAGLGDAYTGGNLGKGVAIHLTDAEEETVSAGLTMLAKLVRTAEEPLLHAWFGVGEKPEMQHHLWVGAYSQLPEAVKEAMPGVVSKQLNVKLPLMELATVSAPSDGGWISTLNENINFSVPKQPKVVHAHVDMSGAFAKNSFAYTTRRNDTTLTVFTASSPSLLAAGVDAVTDAPQWNQLQGSLAFWSPGSPEVSVVSPEDAPFVAYGFRGGLGIWVSQNPWIGLAVLLGAIVFLVVLTRYTLRYYRRR